MERGDVVSVVELRKCINAVFDHLEANLGLESLQLSEDLYWDISEKEVYDFSRRPEDLVVGSLSDDWELLQAIRRDPENATALSLIHIYPLLRFMATKIS